MNGSGALDRGVCVSGRWRSGRDDISWGEFVEGNKEDLGQSPEKQAFMGWWSKRGCLREDGAVREAGERVWHTGPRMKGLRKQGVVSGKAAGGEGRQVPGGKCPLIQPQGRLWR